MNEAAAELAVELNDAGLGAVSVLEGLLPLRSPGYALVRGNSIVSGRAAEERLRHEPRNVHHRFWQGLDRQPLERPFPPDLSTADLAHAHLDSFWREVSKLVDPRRAGRVLIAVPGSMDRHQLGLLVGIARAAGIPLAGLVDAGVAAAVDLAASEESLPEKILHVSLSLHRTVLTELHAPSGKLGSVERGRVALVEVGRHEMLEAWSRHIGSRFVRATRFDPLHRAASEEQLFESLEGWLEVASAQGTVVGELDAGRRRHSVELDLADFTEPVRGAVERIAASAAELGSERALVLLDPALARLPTLGERIELEVGCRWRALAPGAAGRGALLRAAEAGGAPSADVALATRLRIAEGAPVAVTGSTADDEAGADRPAPSHVLHRGVAWDLGESPFVVGSRLDEHEVGLEIDASLDGDGLAPRHCVLLRRGDEVFCAPEGGVTTLYGSALEGPTPVRSGDRLRLGQGVEIELIRVHSRGAHGRGALTPQEPPS